MKKLFMSLAIGTSLLMTALATGAPVFGWEKYPVKALVINESSLDLKVSFYNRGPHAGGCDSKNAVAFTSPSHSLKEFSEDWICLMDQDFMIVVEHPNAEFAVYEPSAQILCDDELCRELDVESSK